VWIIGGGEIYKTFMDEPHVSRISKIYLTHIDREYECDAFFPNIPEDFTEDVEERIERKGVDENIPVEKKDREVDVKYKVYHRICT
jgi:dihydrofolate reductase